MRLFVNLYDELYPVWLTNEYPDKVETLKEAYEVIKKIIEDTNRELNIDFYHMGDTIWSKDKNRVDISLKGDWIGFTILDCYEPLDMILDIWGGHKYVWQKE